MGQYQLYKPLICRLVNLPEHRGATALVSSGGYYVTLYLYRNSICNTMTLLIDALFNRNITAQA